VAKVAGELPIDRVGAFFKVPFINGSDVVEWNEALAALNSMLK
jgi:hypothetical protein